MSNIWMCLFSFATSIRAFLCPSDVNTVTVSSNLHFFHNVKRFLLPSVTADSSDHSHIDWSLRYVAICILNRIIHIGHIHAYNVLYFLSVCYSDFFFFPSGRKTERSLSVSDVKGVLFSLDESPPILPRPSAFC